MVLGSKCCMRGGSRQWEIKPNGALEFAFLSEAKESH